MMQRIVNGVCYQRKRKNLRRKIQIIITKDVGKHQQKIAKISGTIEKLETKQKRILRQIVSKDVEEAILTILQRTLIIRKISKNVQVRKAGHGKIRNVERKSKVTIVIRLITKTPITHERIGILKQPAPEKMPR